MQCGRHYTRQYVHSRSQACQVLTSPSDTLLRHQRHHDIQTSSSQDAAAPAAMTDNNALHSQTVDQLMSIDAVIPNRAEPTPDRFLQNLTTRQDPLSQIGSRRISESQFMKTSNGIDLTPGGMQTLSALQASGPNMLPMSEAATIGDTTSSQGADVMQTPLSRETFDSCFDTQFPSWLIDENFDLEMLNTPIAVTMADLAPRYPSEMPRPTSQSAPNVKHFWFTNISIGYNSEQVSGTTTPTTTQTVETYQNVVDEDYRKTLQERLRHRTQDQPLPSPDFLNLCVRMFFAHVNPVFPVVHAPTFRPSAQNSMLLLSICSVGSLFTGSANAAELGIQIFERLNKAVLAKWDRLISKDIWEVVPMIQASLIGQTFGLLSGHSKHLATVESFHGTVISWARRVGVFEARHKVIHLDNLSQNDLDQSWRTWARNEELLRLRLGLHVHDAELTGIFHHEPLLRHSIKRIPQCASDEVFSAATAADWAIVYQNQARLSSDAGTNRVHSGLLHSFGLEGISVSARFTIYVVLECVAADVAEQRAMEALDTAKVDNTQSFLLTFYRKYLKHISSTESDTLGVLTLWHLTFMSLYVDFDLLERAIGRDGPPAQATDVATITQWASSVQAKRCVIHASLIHKNLEKMPIGFEPAIHVPRAMFLAAISWYCFIHYGPPPALESHPMRESLDFPEIRLLGVNSAALLFESNGFRRETPKNVNASGALCGLADLLQRIGHWEIARKFGPILAALIHQEKS